MNHEVPKLDPAFTHELLKLLSERTAHCPRCNYSLSGVPGPRCPECGKNIAYHLRVADTTPWRLPEMRRRALIRRLSRTAALCALIAATVISIGYAVAALSH
jgi:tRNA(Ile2) C34 agmatinyltransferase TiaS